MSIQPTVETSQKLVATVQEAATWLRELNEETVRHKPTPDRWSIAEVVGHMIDSACNNHQRFIRAQETDALTFPKYDQNFWVDKARYHESNWSDLVEFWRLYNLQLAEVITGIPPHKLSTPCTISPYDTCTLEFLTVDYLDHLIHHVTKIKERVT